MTGSAVTWTISHIRRQLGQGVGSRAPIETVHGRGYRFIPPLGEVLTQLSTVGQGRRDDVMALRADLSALYPVQQGGRETGRLRWARILALQSSVIGQVFELPLLKSLCDPSMQGLMSNLEPALDDGFIRAETQTTCDPRVGCGARLLGRPRWLRG